MSHPLLMFDAEAWRAAWLEAARRGLPERLGDLPDWAFEPLSCGLPREWVRSELLESREFDALPAAARQECARLAEGDPFLARAPASLWLDGNAPPPAPFEALELRAPIIQAKRLDAGERVSYGHAYAMPRAGAVATIAIGYGDGYRRCFSNRAWMRFENAPAPVAGRVCMDQTLLDLSDHPAAASASAGAFVLVAGGRLRPEAGERGCDFATLARAFDLPVHELLAGLGPRLNPARSGASALEPAPRFRRGGQNLA